MLALVHCLMMATIKSCTPVDLRNNKLEHSLLNRSLFGLPVQEAILHDQLFLGFGIGHSSLLLGHLQQSFLGGLTRSFLVLDYLIEDRVPFLFKFPVNNIGSGQSHWPSIQSLFLMSILVTQVRLHSLLSPVNQGLR